MDPLAEAPEAVWYVRPSVGGQYGPAPADVMRAWIAEGRIGPDCLVWREGWRDWREAADVFPQSGSNATGADLGPLGTGAATSAGPAKRRSRRPSRGRATVFHAAILTVLILAVIVLLTVFLWVLQGGTEPLRDASTRAPGSAPRMASRFDDVQRCRTSSAMALKRRGA
jgi:hypothetical protein